MSNKPKANDLTEKMKEIRSGQASPNLYRLQNQWYTDDHGRVFETTSLEQKEARRKWSIRQEQIERGIDRTYVNCYHESIKELTGKLKLNELGALIKLLPFLRFNKDGQLIKNGQPMNKQDIAKVIGKSVRATSTVLNRLVDEGVIVKSGSNRKPIYSINEEYHTIGYTLKDEYYTKLYQKETRLRADKLTIQESGLLYKILPYFHYQNYYLCANPNADESKEDVQHLNQAELAEEIDENYSQVKRLMNGLVRYGFVMKMSAFKAVHFRVNPDIMFRQESETKYTREVRGEFEELAKTSDKMQ